MKRLLVDKGNTLIKWRLLETDSWQDVVTHSGNLKEFSAWLSGGQISDPSEVRVDVSAVRGIENLTEVFAELNFSQVFFHKTQAESNGVINSYEVPERMGIDRWLVMLAGQQQFAQGFIVVDAGTAFTIDVVEAGVHQGGYILPGVNMAQQALYGNTDKVKPYGEEQAENPDGQLGKNTVQCVEFGILNQLLAIVRQVQQDFPQLSVLLTGGDAALFAPYLKQAVLDADLVFKGLFTIGKV